MRQDQFHATDEELLLELDGEGLPQERRKIQAHLEACWECRSRRRELEGTIAEFTKFHLREWGSRLPPVEGARALLKAQLSVAAAEGGAKRWRWPWSVQRTALPWAAAGVGVCALAILLLGMVMRHPVSAAEVSVPDTKLTPGATVLADRTTICGFANVKNKAVPAAMRRRVFEEYGLRGAASSYYEVDYLVTPALGGADDIRNLWPHSYAAAWNARVKDELEDRLREMVCGGELELNQAQTDLATDWIAAYKKYFHTDRPLPAR